jgi:DNA/RNA endonuclease YhcR with UshA esterase domain
MSQTMHAGPGMRLIRIAGMAGFMATAALLPCPSSSAQDVVTPADVHKFVRQAVTVRGTVAGVYTSGKGNTFLNFGAPYPRQQLSAVIFASDAPLFSDVDLAALEGHAVSITGVVKLYKGKPEIVLNRRDQLAADK